MNKITANLSVEQLAGMIDYTFLKPYGTEENIEKICSEAHKYGFAMVATIEAYKELKTKDKNY